MLLISKGLKNCFSFSEYFYNTPPTPLFRGEFTSSFPSIKRGLRGVCKHQVQNDKLFERSSLWINSQ